MKTMKRAALLVSAALTVSACSHGGGTTPTVGHTTTSPGSTSSSSPGGTFTESDFTCPTSDTASSTARASSLAIASLGRRPVAERTRSNAAPVTPLLAVTYDAASLARSRAQIEAREANLGATFVREYTFAHTGKITRVVRPASGSIATLEGALRAMPDVVSVGETGYRRHALSVNAPFLTNDPYFKGLSGTSQPLYQKATTEGQWDMHVTRLEDAFAYSQADNGSGIVSGNALGSSGIKIAIIDSGEDPTHPELSTKIAYQKCFITNPDNAQSTSDFETDPVGHGTSVSGVAAADSGNAFGFSGSSGLALIDAYRVFPTPDDNCTSDSTTDAQCTADSQDISSAIEDAVSQQVNVINLSLGGDSCATTGVDPDATEGAAIADAIAANIVVVAAAGNDSGESPEAPACDSGVIAVGATALSDGTTNGTGNTTGSSGSPREYVPSYSNVGSPGANVNSENAWGIVAPGGDPGSDTDADDLHWIDNIWTSTPFDDNFAGTCTADDLPTTTTIDCRTLIAGTSLSSPNVAGIAALVLAANSTYQSPTKMKQLLCETADDIGDANEGCGRVDAYRAMAVALNDPNEPSQRKTP